MPAGWRVVSQRGTEDIVNGKFVQVMEIVVETTDGATNTFRVPQTQYTAELVKAKVNDWYERYQSVVDL